MTEVFGETYAGAYDALYGAKDYAGEVDLIERILAREGKPGARRILDLGCGTGNHALPLAQRGHSIVGVDRSPSMLAKARAKASAIGATSPTFLQGDVRDADVGTRFDAVLMMFAVLGYLHDDADVVAALTTVRRHLEPEGLFIFDVWNGLAVLADPPKGRHIAVADGAARIERETRSRLEPDRNLCHVRFDLARIEAGGVVQSASEEHVMRYFFAEDLGDLLKRSGLDLLGLRRFPDGERPADDSAWNIVGVARAAGTLDPNAVAGG